MHKQDFHRDVAHGQSQAQDTSLGVGDYTQLGKVLDAEEAKHVRGGLTRQARGGNTKSERWWT
jgi:hypothetical protein